MFTLNCGSALHAVFRRSKVVMLELRERAAHINPLWRTKVGIEPGTSWHRGPACAKQKIAKSPVAAPQQQLIPAKAHFSRKMSRKRFVVQDDVSRELRRASWLAQSAGRVLSCNLLRTFPGATSLWCNLLRAFSLQTGATCLACALCNLCVVIGSARRATFPEESLALLRGKTPSQASSSHGAGKDAPQGNTASCGRRQHAKD